MPFQFGATDVSTINGGTFIDVAGNMRVSNTNHTDSHDFKVNSDNISMKSYGNITAGAGGGGGDGIATNGGAGTGGNGGAGGSINLNSNGEGASRIRNTSPKIGKATKAAKNAVVTRVFKDIKAGIGGKGGGGDTEGGMGGRGGSTQFKLSSEADYEFSGIEAGIGGEGGRGRVKGGQGGSGGDLSVA